MEELPLCGSEQAPKVVYFGPHGLGDGIMSLPLVQGLSISRRRSSLARPTAAARSVTLELAVQGALVGLDRVDRDIQLRADLAPRQGRGQKPEDFDFLAGEFLAERGRGRAPRCPAGQPCFHAVQQSSPPGHPGIPAQPQNRPGFSNGRPGRLLIAQVLAGILACARSASAISSLPAPPAGRMPARCAASPARSVSPRSLRTLAVASETIMSTKCSPTAASRSLVARWIRCSASASWPRSAEMSPDSRARTSGRRDCSLHQPAARPGAGRPMPPGCGQTSSGWPRRCSRRRNGPGARRRDRGRSPVWRRQPPRRRRRS